LERISVVLSGVGVRVGVGEGVVVGEGVIVGVFVGVGGIGVSVGVEVGSGCRAAHPESITLSSTNKKNNVL